VPLRQRGFGPLVPVYADDPESRFDELDSEREADLAEAHDPDTGAALLDQSPQASAPRPPARGKRSVDKSGTIMVSLVRKVNKSQGFHSMCREARQCHGQAWPSVVPDRQAWRAGLSATRRDALLSHGTCHWMTQSVLALPGEPAVLRLVAFMSQM